MARFLAARAIPGVERVDSAGRYHRSIALGSLSGAIVVGPAADGSGLEAAIRIPDLELHPSIVCRLRRMFDLDADPQAIGAAISADPLLAPMIAARPGLRVPGAWDPFELAVRAILGQQVSVAGATTLAGRLVAAYGQPLADTTASGLTHLFPEPRRLAVADLRPIGIPGARARAISTLAAAAADDLRLFAADGAAITRLRALPGIGDWTAQYIAMRALRDPDAFPAGDIGLMRALADAEGRRPSSQEMLARAEAWRPYRAYAVLHLWTSETVGGGSNAA